MNKKNYIVILFCILCLFNSSCGSEGRKYADNAKVEELSHLGEKHILGSAIMSDQETDRLRYLLKEETSWKDAEPCVCANGYYGWDVVLDGVYYRVCNWYRMSFSKDIHPISYKNSADEKYMHAIISENDEIMIEINNMVANRSGYGTSFDIFLDEHREKTKEAIIRPLWSEDSGEEVVVSEKDTERLRSFLAIESGWKQNVPCLCIGSAELILDNVGYIIDLTDTEHQIKYCEVGKEGKQYALENENKNVVQEVYDIVEKYVDWNLF